MTDNNDKMTVIKQESKPYCASTIEGTVLKDLSTGKVENQCCRVLSSVSYFPRAINSSPNIPSNYTDFKPYKGFHVLKGLC